jgi:predicted dehydrogenase
VGEKASAGTLRVGIVGASNIAPTTIVEPARKRNDVVVTAVASRNPERAAKFAEKHGIAHAALGYADLFAREDVDIVYVGLPPSEHAAVSIAALNAGKAVLCEKVFAMDVGEARDMVAAAEKVRRPLIEAILYRFHPMIVRAIDIVATGQLGVIRKADVTAKATLPKIPNGIGWNPSLGGGALLEFGCFPVHLLRSILGKEPEVISATAAWEDGVDVSGDASLKFGDASASIACAINAKPSINLVLEGDKGRIEINNYLLPQHGYRFQVQAKELSIDEMSPVGSPYDAQLAHVVEVMMGRARPLTGGPDAIANMVVIDAIKRARMSAS